MPRLVRMKPCPPFGYHALRYLIFGDSYTRHAIYIFFLTFLCYTFYHASRRPISVTKVVLHSGAMQMDPLQGFMSKGWAPFDQDNWSQLIGSLEYAYLMAYAVAMIFSGYIAERTNLRYFLTCGMFLSGVCNIAFGLAYYLDIHNFSYFMVIQLISGLVQASGWPAVVTLMGNWWGGRRRGFIMGLWNAHTSVGNILGSIVAGLYVNSNWAQSFIVPGWIMIGGGVLVFLTLISRPETVPLGPRTFCDSPPRFLIGPDAEFPQTDSSAKRAVTFREALFLPNVLAYSILLFFAKLVSYTFLYWLPNYLALSETGQVTPEQAAQLSVLFDLGGILGGIVAGISSDSRDPNTDTDIARRRAATCSVMLALVAPLLIIYQCMPSATSTLSLVILFTCGLLINGPYALITTAVSADLGTQPALQGRGRALATVTAIIDAMGSLGAAFGPFLTGILVPLGWSAVFLMLVISDLCALGISLWIACRNTVPKNFASRPRVLSA